jgi:WD40 repeat protein
MAAVIGGLVAILLAGWFSIAPWRRWSDERQSPAAIDHESPTATAQHNSQDQNESRSTERILRAHHQVVAVVALACRGQCLLSADTEGNIRVWDFYTGELLTKFDAPDLRLRRAILAPDGKQVIACGNDPTIRVWSGRTGKVLRDYRGHSAGVTAVRWIPGSRRFISSSFDSSLIVWDVDTGDIERRFGTAENAETLAPTTAQELAQLGGHITWVRDVVVLPDGKRALSAGNEGVVFIWDLQSGTITNRLVGHQTVIMALALSPDGRHVASLSSDRELIVWDLEDSQLLCRRQHRHEKPPAIAFTPDGRILAVGGDDGMLSLIDIQSSAINQESEIADAAITALAFTADSDVICGCADGLIRIRPIKELGQ